MGRVEWQWWVSRTINVPWYQCVSSLREYQVLLVWICTHTGCTFPSLGKFVLCEVAVTRVSREQLILIPGYSEKASPPPPPPAKCPQAHKSQFSRAAIRVILGLGSYNTLQIIPQGKKVRELKGSLVSFLELLWCKTATRVRWLWKRKEGSLRCRCSAIATSIKLRIASLRLQVLCLFVHKFRSLCFCVFMWWKCQDLRSHKKTQYLKW